MPQSPLACTVRDCGLPLERRNTVLVCPQRHTYDVARSGYVNLLQPQDRKSPAAGDSKAAIEARARLLASGTGRTILDAFVQRASSLCTTAHATVVDLGSGSGEVLAALRAAREIAGFGIDVSTAAADYAARHCPSVTWIVANADRRLPLLDRSIGLVLSLHARRNPVECARVLSGGGSLLVAVPASDDLIELRTTVQGGRLERDRTGLLLAEHDPFFTVVDRWSIREHHRLEREALMDLLQVSYRGGRLSEAASVRELTSLEVTMASDLCLFAPRGSGSG